jgi:hypothetical protein
MKTLRILLALSFFLCAANAFAGGETLVKSANKFCKSKEAATARTAYIYLKASYQSIQDDAEVSHFSQVIAVDLNNWAATKTREVYRFEEFLATKDRNRTYIGSFSWISKLYKTEVEAREALNKEAMAAKKMMQIFKW